ncbi:NAD(P)-binding domain-containing protein [Nocardioides antri]|uniref:NAD(P)-binding domain-containing protein n=1 Tax=Nocardioides antri TaxID=2607659 RepID=UPI00165FF033|nr:NAD(P)-binding domain-containing protein [Nocardioides antri]
MWNRTAERARALAAVGAEVQASAREALTAAPLVIVCVSATEDVRHLLEEASSEPFDGLALLNMTSGTPEDGRDLRNWAQAHGVAYLDAAIGAYPEQLGTRAARILVAGDEALFRTHQELILEIAGSSMYVGADHGAANAIDCALTGAFYISSLVSFIEAVRFVHEFGVSHDVLSDLSSYSVSVLDHQMKLALDRVARNDFTTDQATLNVYADAVATFAAGLEGRGDALMVQAATRVLRQAVDAGLGDQDIAAAVTLRPSAPGESARTN